MKNEIKKAKTSQDLFEIVKKSTLQYIDLVDGRFYNTFANRKMTKAEVVDMLIIKINDENVAENNRIIKDFIENTLGIERFAFSCSSSYYRINGNVIRVSSHWVTSEKYDEPTINTWSCEKSGHVVMIEKIKNIL